YPYPYPMSRAAERHHCRSRLRTPTTPPRSHGLHHRPPPHDGNLPRGARCLTSRGDAARSAPRGPLSAWRAADRGVAPARNLTPDAVWGRSQTEESDGTDDPRAGWWGGEGHGARGRVEGRPGGRDRGRRDRGHEHRRARRRLRRGWHGLERPRAAGLAPPEVGHRPAEPLGAADQRDPAAQRLP